MKNEAKTPIILANKIVKPARSVNKKSSIGNVAQQGESYIQRLGMYKNKIPSISHDYQESYLTRAQSKIQSQKKITNSSILNGSNGGSKRLSQVSLAASIGSNTPAASAIKQNKDNQQKQSQQQQQQQYIGNNSSNGGGQADTTGEISLMNITDVVLQQLGNKQMVLQQSKSSITDAAFGKSAPVIANNGSQQQPSVVDYKLKEEKQQITNNATKSSSKDQQAITLILPAAKNASKLNNDQKNKKGRRQTTEIKSHQQLHQQRESIASKKNITKFPTDVKKAIQNAYGNAEGSLAISTGKTQSLHKQKLKNSQEQQQIVVKDDVEPEQGSPTKLSSRSSRGSSQNNIKIKKRTKIASENEDLRIAVEDRRKYMHSQVKNPIEATGLNNESHNELIGFGQARIGTKLQTQRLEVMLKKQNHHQSQLSNSVEFPKISQTQSNLQVQEASAGSQLLPKTQKEYQKLMLRGGLSSSVGSHQIKQAAMAIKSDRTQKSMALNRRSVGEYRESHQRGILHGEILGFSQPSNKNTKNASAANYGQLGATLQDQINGGKVKDPDHPTSLNTRRVRQSFVQQNGEDPLKKRQQWTNEQKELVQHKSSESLKIAQTKKHQLLLPLKGMSKKVNKLQKEQNQLKNITGHQTKKQPIASQNNKKIGTSLATTSTDVKPSQQSKEKMMKQQVANQQQQTAYPVGDAVFSPTSIPNTPLYSPAVYAKHQDKIKVVNQLSADKRAVTSHKDKHYSVITSSSKQQKSPSFKARQSNSGLPHIVSPVVILNTSDRKGHPNCAMAVAEGKNSTSSWSSHRQSRTVHNSGQNSVRSKKSGYKISAQRGSGSTIEGHAAILSHSEEFFDQHQRQHYHQQLPSQSNKNEELNLIQSLNGLKHTQQRQGKNRNSDAQEHLNDKQAQLKKLEQILTPHNKSNSKDNRVTINGVWPKQQNMQQKPQHLQTQGSPRALNSGTIEDKKMSTSFYARQNQDGYTDEIFQSEKKQQSVNAYQKGVQQQIQQQHQILAASPRKIENNNKNPYLKVSSTKIVKSSDKATGKQQQVSQMNQKKLKDNGQQHQQPHISTSVAETREFLQVDYAELSSPTLDTRHQQIQRHQQHNTIKELHQQYYHENSKSKTMNQNFTLSNTIDGGCREQQFAGGFNQPAAPTAANSRGVRGADARLQGIIGEKQKLDHISEFNSQDIDRPGTIYRSTRQPPKRIEMSQGPQSMMLNAGSENMTAILKGFSGGRPLPYHVQLKGKKNVKQYSRADIGQTKSGIRSNKIGTPSTHLNNPKRRHAALASMSSSIQQHTQKSSIANVQSEGRIVEQKVNLHSSQVHQTHKMPSLNKINQKQSKHHNQADKAVSLPRAVTNTHTSRMGRNEMAAHQSNDLILAQRGSNSRGKVRHTSIMPPQVKNTNSIFSNLVEVKKGQKSQAIAPDTSTHKKLTGPNDQVNESQNVSVKDRIQKDKPPRGTSNRNITQQWSRTSDMKAAERASAVIEKMNFRSQNRPNEREKNTTDDYTSQRQIDSGPPSPVVEEGKFKVEQEGKPQIVDNFIVETNESASKPNTVKGKRRSVGVANHQVQKQLNERSELTTLKITTRYQGAGGLGSKLEPITTKESVNLKNVSIEKRLKNSETVPEIISPMLPNKSHTIIKDSASNQISGLRLSEIKQSLTANSKNQQVRRNNLISKTKDEQERKNRQLSTSGIRNKHGSQDQTISGVLPTRITQSYKDTAAQKAENFSRQQQISLRNFRALIDQRRVKIPEKQPLELNEFQMNLKIGQGAFAIVRRATHKQSKHIIAIKTYEKKNLQDKETQQAVHREINCLSDLWHPNIMKLHEVVDQRTQVHLIMELCQGMSIFHHIKKMPEQRLPEDTCKHIFKQLMRAIAYMHSKGYAHRDLKLDNILMDVVSKNIKIIDFGFSLQAKSDEKLKEFCGTPHYMDPDIVRKSAYNGPAADVWACGVILYIIFVGKLPFFGEFEADLFRKIQNGKFKAVPTNIGDEKVRNLFRRIFDTNPNTRITAQQCIECSWLKDAPVDQEQEQQILREQLQQQEQENNGDEATNEI